MQTIQTSRLLLREWRSTDVDDLFEYAKDPDTGPNAGWQPHQNKEESAKIIEMFQREQQVWAIVEQKDQKVIGSIGLHQDQHRRNDKSRMLGYVIAKAYWGKGYATEAAQAVLRYAFTNLELELVSVMHFHFNLASKRVIEKCGFRYEGTLRQAIRLFDGCISDDVCYSLLRQEWQLLQADQKSSPAATLL